MPYQLIDGDEEQSSVRRLTFVPFLPDGRCVVLPGPELPTGVVRDDEHYLLDSCLRIPVETVEFRPQRVHPFAADGGHMYVWLDGDRDIGGRPCSPFDVMIASGADLVNRLDAATATVMLDALRSFRIQSDASYYADNLRLLEPAYLRGATPQAGSGFGDGPDRWRARRELIVDGMHRSGTFLDVGCANGLLMESVREWASERGLAIEPYGVDFAPRLVELARLRLPHWAERIEVGNAINYVPTDARRFTFVHVLLDAVPRWRRAELIQHALQTLVEPGGRLLVRQSQGRDGMDLTAKDVLSELGFEVAGSSRAKGPDRGVTTAWLNA